jgi:transposase, IS6 family
MIKPRPALFKWRHFEPEVIVCAVRWYLRFSLSYRDVEELLMERSHHTSVWRWVQRYAPELNKRCRRELKPTNGSWRVDETYICQGGRWRLSLAKMLSGVNALEITDIQEEKTDAG